MQNYRLNGPGPLDETNGTFAPKTTHRRLIISQVFTRFTLCLRHHRDSWGATWLEGAPEYCVAVPLFLGGLVDTCHHEAWSRLLAAEVNTLMHRGILVFQFWPGDGVFPQRLGPSHQTHQSDLICVTDHLFWWEIHCHIRPDLWFRST